MTLVRSTRELVLQLWIFDGTLKDWNQRTDARMSPTGIDEILLEIEHGLYHGPICLVGKSSRCFSSGSLMAKN